MRISEQFPVAEMAGQNQRPGVLEFCPQLLPLGQVGKAYPLAEVLRGQGVQVAKFRDQPTKVEPALTQDRAALSLAFLRKDQRQIEQPNPAVGPVEQVQEPSNPFTRMEGKPERQETEEREEGEKE